MNIEKYIERIDKFTEKNPTLADVIFTTIFILAVVGNFIAFIYAITH